MKKLLVVSILAMFYPAFLFAGDQVFTFAMTKFLINEGPVQAQVKKIDQQDEGVTDFLDFLSKNTTVNVNKKVEIITFKRADELEKYPFIFLSANGPILFSDLEVKNMAEYCKRGGFLFVDDCVTPDGKGSLLFNSFKKLAEERIFPGYKFQKLPIDHEIYHCFFDVPKGLPYMQGEAAGGWAMFDEKGRILIFLSPSDIHCGWFAQQNWFGPKKTQEAFEMGANIVIYAMTH